MEHGSGPEQVNSEQEQGSPLLVPECAFRKDGEAEYLENFAVHSMTTSAEDMASLPTPSLLQVSTFCLSLSTRVLVYNMTVCESTDRQSTRSLHRSSV